LLIDKKNEPKIMHWLIVHKKNKKEKRKKRRRSWRRGKLARTETSFLSKGTSMVSIVIILLNKYKTK
jgi:hypothetical protein